MLAIDNSAVVLVDVQGTLARMVDDSAHVIHNIALLLEGARLLKLPIIWMEQLPEKLGQTVPELQALLHGIEPIAKKSFSGFGDANIRAAIEQSRRQHILLCGIETHICVYQTARDLLAHQYQAHIIGDAVSSRSALNKNLALQELARIGAHLSSVELALYQIMQTAEHPQFRDAVQLVKKYNQSSAGI